MKVCKSGKMNDLVHFQFSLMLEYCPKGDLRSYLIDHEKEFKTSLKYYHEHGCMTESSILNESIAHDIRLLCVWACQVDFLIMILFVFI